ncbi:MAG: hypothetical protein OSB57_04270 [Planctomycetota bacterium]|nr:hypothetical protein [Planctomycetota bacterium]
MTYTPLRLSTSLSLLTLLAACGERGVPVEAATAIAKETDSEVGLREGGYGIVRAGDFHFGDSEVTWTIYTSKPMRIALDLVGDKGHIGNESETLLAEGPCIYHIRFSQEEVEGSDLLTGVSVLGGEEASGAVLAAVPDFNGQSAFRFTLDIGASDTVNAKAIPAEITSSSSSSGWVPGSRTERQEVSATRMASAIGSEDLEQYTLGEPIYIAHCVELIGETSSISAFQRGDDFMVRYAIDSEEAREVPLSEYEGRAWALRLMLTQQD